MSWQTRAISSGFPLPPDCLAELGQYRYNNRANHGVPAVLSRVNDQLESILKSVGLKVARQNFTYKSSGHAHAGENLYAILQAPRGDATEALVLIAAWKNVRSEVNKNGVALALTLARYFRRWSLWSKDIIFLFPPDSLAGPQAWVDAYHDSHDGRHVSPLPLKSGALQGAVALDYVQEGRFESVHFAYDGINGQLPNLDLINSVVSIAGGQMGMGVALQEMWRDDDAYPARLRTMLRGMLKQGLGMSSGPHSSFMAYHVDAVTLQPFGEGWQDEMAMGRVIEGTFRSLNNLLEHLHQSFFFYLLMGRERFVSIGTYLPSAMLVAANFTIMAIALWVKSGQPRNVASSPDGDKKSDPAGEVKKVSSPTVERDLFLPLGIVVACQSLGVVPLYLFNHLPAGVRDPPPALLLLSPKFVRHANDLAATHARFCTLYCSKLRLAAYRVPAPRDVSQPFHAAVPVDEILLSPSAGDVSVLSRNSKLLPGISSRATG